MKLIWLVSVLAVIGLGITAQAQSRKVFPYNYTIDDLPNGLRLIVIPTDYPNLVSVYTVVQAGSRISLNTLCFAAAKTSPPECSTR
jgi:zinc protease